MWRDFHAALFYRTYSCNGSKSNADDTHSTDFRGLIHMIRSDPRAIFLDVR
jgi:hypothetical protein